jgi:hypothetical protein
MIQKAFDSITNDDIDALVADEVREGRTLDYKEKSPGNADKDKKEFLADVSSFANASGGDMIFGVVEKRDGEGKATGLPQAAPGLAGVNADMEIRRLDSMVRDGIKPRIPGVQIRVVEGFADGPVLVMRTPRNFAAQHVVTFQDHSRFYSRISGGKYPLDVGEIRTAFAYSETLPERVRRFREERLGRVVAAETRAGPKDGPKVVLHLLPLRSLDPAFQIDLAAVAASRVTCVPRTFCTEASSRSSPISTEWLIGQSSRPMTITDRLGRSISEPTPKVVSAWLGRSSPTSDFRIRAGFMRHAQTDYQPGTWRWTIQNVFREFNAKRAKKDKVRPHDLRARAITLVAAATQSVDATAEALGLDPQTARHYLDSATAFKGTELLQKLAGVLLPEKPPEAAAG